MPAQISKRRVKVMDEYRNVRLKKPGMKIGVGQREEIIEVKWSDEITWKLSVNVRHKTFQHFPRSAVVLPASKRDLKEWPGAGGKPEGLGAVLKYKWKRSTSRRAKDMLNPDPG